MTRTLGLAPAPALVVGALVLLSGCPTPPEPPPDPLVPANYRETYTEVRDCRMSADHDLSNVRVYADAVAAGPYLDRDRPFPVGALLIKEQFDFADTDCSGPMTAWTIMQRLADGSAPLDIDWEWEVLDEEYVVDQEAELYRCPECHMGCDPPGGYAGTCAEED